jgi:two-component system KDP operon response regulator KdpE
MDGKDVLRRLREWTITPVVVVSVRQEEEEKIACFDSGADDYITKPFAMGELLARLRAALRRAFGVPRGKVFTAGALQIDFASREVMVESRAVKLTATEYDLLKALASHAGSVRTHRQLIHEVWGSTHYQDAAHLLRATMSHLRRKLVSDSGGLCPIATSARVGYSLQAGEMKRYLGPRSNGADPTELLPADHLAKKDAERQRQDQGGGSRHGYRATWST